MIFSPWVCEDRRNKHIAVRVTQAELEQIEQAAQKDGKGATTWAREILLAQTQVDE